MRGAASAAPFRLRTTSEDNVTIETATAQPTFSKFLGIRIVDIKPERVTAQLAVREEFKNCGGVMHGGAVMAFADSLGGTTANANLPEGQRTSTIESKTFSSPASRSAIRPMPNACRCMSAAPPSSCKPASRAATASSPPS